MGSKDKFWLSGWRRTGLAVQVSAAQYRAALVGEDRRRGGGRPGHPACASGVGVVSGYTWLGPTASFARDGREVYYGNQVLAGHVLGYDPGKQFRQHQIVGQTFLGPPSGLRRQENPLQREKDVVQRVIRLLDALIGNTTDITKTGASCAKGPSGGGRACWRRRSIMPRHWAANWWMRAPASAAAGCWQKADWRSMRRRRPVRFSGK